MTKSLHFDYQDVGHYDGDQEHHIMCNFYSVKNGVVYTGHSQIVLAHEWPQFRAYLEAGGWTHRHMKIFKGRA